MKHRRDNRGAEPRRADVERLAALVRRLRTDSGQSLRALASAAGVDIAYLSRLENAGYDLPNPLYLRDVADALEVPPLELLIAAGYVQPEDLLSRRRKGGSK